MGRKNSAFYTAEDVETAQMQVSAVGSDRPSNPGDGGDDEISMHKAIFEYLCENVSYDYELSDAIIFRRYRQSPEKNRGCYGALIQKETVCSRLCRRV